MLMRSRAFRTLLAVLLLGGSAVDASAAAILRAHVQFVGKVPRMGALKRTEAACGGQKFATEEDVLVGATGGLKNVLVYVSRGVPAGAKLRDADFTLQSCMFRPRVTAVTTGGLIRITNTDPVNHLWHAFHGTRTLWLDPHAAGAPAVSREVKEKPGDVIRLRDDQRPWMAAFVVVTDNPYFQVSNDLGDALVMEMPAGLYTVTAWHERYGAKTAEVTVGQDGYADVRFAYDGNEPRP